MGLLGRSLLDLQFHVQELQRLADYGQVLHQLPGVSTEGELVVECPYCKGRHARIKLNGVTVAVKERERVETLLDLAEAVGAVERRSPSDRLYPLGADTPYHWYATLFVQDGDEYIIKEENS